MTMCGRRTSWPSGAARLCFAGIVISLLLCSCAELPGESQTRHYPTHADAERDGSFARGWLPADIPADATEIVESHNLDSNQMWVRFNLSATAPERLLQRCVVDPEVPLPHARQTRRTAKWWPEALIAGEGALPLAAGRAYRCSDLGREPTDRPFGVLDSENQCEAAVDWRTECLGGTPIH